MLPQTYSGLYSKVRNWEQQLHTLSTQVKSESLPAISCGRVVTKPPPSGWTFKGWLNGPDNDEEIQELKADASQLIHAAHELNEKLALDERGVLPAPSDKLNGLTVRQLQSKLHSLLTTQSCQLVRGFGYLEQLFQETTQQISNPEASLRFCSDELQTCYSRFLACAPESTPPDLSCMKFSAAINGWLVEKSRALRNNPNTTPEQFEAHRLLQERCGNFMLEIYELSQGAFKQVTRQPSPPPSPDLSNHLTLETARGELSLAIRTSEDAIMNMKIPDDFPDAREMFLTDLKIFETQFEQELSVFPDGQISYKWLKGQKQRLEKMRETMYYAVRSPDRPPIEHPGRIGLVNHHIDCEPNSHVQAFAHLNAYDYFLYRVISVTPDPGAVEPVLDESELEEQQAELEALQRAREEAREKQRNQKPPAWNTPRTVREQMEIQERRLQEELDDLNQRYSNLSYEIRTLKKAGRERHRAQVLAWNNQKYHRKNDLKNQEEQLWWRKVFEELRNPPKGQRAVTLHRPGEGDVFRAEPFHDDLVPEPYKLRFPDAKTFLWGGSGHWRCLVKSKQGGIDLLNDSTVTKNYFSSVDKMIDHFNSMEIFSRRQVTLVTESTMRPRSGNTG